jgi:uncharacterized glyoxalase superfamily protein PhnB
MPGFGPEAGTEFRSTIIPGHRYRNAAGAIDWLCRVFGFERHAVYPGEDGTIAHAELTLGGGMIMLGTGRNDEYGGHFKTPLEMGGIETGSTYIVVADVDAAYKWAVAAGAMVIRPLQDTPYGSREFTVKDPEGYSWSVGTYDPWSVNG